MVKSKLLFLLVFASPTFIFAQNNNSIFFGTGIGVSTNTRSDGMGLLCGVGYQKSYFNGRLRLVPQLTFWGFDNKGTTHAPSVFSYSRGLRVDLNYDIFFNKSFSVLFGTGITGNLTSGVVSGGGFFRETHLAINGSLGFRLTPMNRKLWYELRLFEVAVEPPYGEEFVEAGILKFNFIYKLEQADNSH